MLLLGNHKGDRTRGVGAVKVLALQNLPLRRLLAMNRTPPINLIAFILNELGVSVVLLYNRMIPMNFRSFLHETNIQPRFDIILN